MAAVRCITLNYYSNAKQNPKPAQMREICKHRSIIVTQQKFKSYNTTLLMETATLIRMFSVIGKGGNRISNRIGCLAATHLMLG